MVSEEKNQQETGKDPEKLKKSRQGGKICRPLNSKNR